MNPVLTKLLEAIGSVSSPFSLAAFAIATVLLILWVTKSKRPFPITLLVVAIAALVFLAIAPLLVGSRAVYHVRATIVDPKDVPVDDATVWLSIGGEAKKVAGGWQFDVPAATVPTDRKVMVFAAVKNAFLAGRQSLDLGNDHNPAVIVKLAPDSTARVRGIVVDANGRGLAGARVSVVGYESEALVTAEGGGFELPAHAAEGQQVYLHAQKDGYAGANLWHPAGNAPTQIELSRNAR